MWEVEHIRPPLVRTRWRVALGREVIGEKQDAHDYTQLS